MKNSYSNKFVTKKFDARKNNQLKASVVKQKGTKVEIKCGSSGGGRNSMNIGTTNIGVTNYKGKESAKNTDTTGTN